MKHYPDLAAALSRIAVPSYADLQCRALAKIIAELVNENEPLLDAQVGQATITIRERGGGSVFTVKVSA